MTKTSKKKGKKRAAQKIKNSKGRTTKGASIEKALADNFISLQKVMVNLSAKFDSLTNQISKLLELFEISAKSLAMKDLESEKENKDAKKILEKLDNISQQSGLIGKGLALIHKVSSEKEIPETKSMPEPMQPVRPQSPPIYPKKKPMSEYQRSISSNISEKDAYDVDKSTKSL